MLSGTASLAVSLRFRCPIDDHGGQQLWGWIMHSTMQDFPLTVTSILRHGTGWSSSRRVTTATPDGYRDISYGELGTRVAQLAHGLRQLGVTDGDRVATFMWNNQEHLEAYFAAPCMGAVLHTLNIRLSGEQIAFIANQAEDRVVLVDMSLAPLLAATLPEMTSVQTVVAVGEGDVAPLTASRKTRDPLRRPAGWTTARVRLARSGRKKRRRNVLHQRHDGKSEGCGVQPPLELSAFDGGVRGQRNWPRRRRPRLADRPDVPRQRLGPAVCGRDGRRRLAAAGPLPAGRPAGRHD